MKACLWPAKEDCNLDSCLQTINTLFDVPTMGLLLLITKQPQHDM